MPSPSSDTNHIEVLRRMRDFKSALAVDPMIDVADEVAALDAAIQSLSAGASGGGEEAEIIADAIKLASDGVTFGCPADVADWLRDAIAAAPQPAQAGASGGGEFIDEWERRFGFLATQNDPRSIESIDEVACLLTDKPTPASPATGDEKPRPDPSMCAHKFMGHGHRCLRCGWDFTNGDVPPAPQPATVQEPQWAGWLRSDVENDNHPLSTTPQPAADAPTEGSWIAAADVRRLAREIDVALNGEEGAARAPALCDIAAQVKAEARKLGRPILATPQPESARGEWVMVDGRRYDVETVKTALLGLASDVIAAAPQPQQASAQGDAAAEQYRQAHNAGEVHGRIMAALEVATPPAHGDGEMVLRRLLAIRHSGVDLYTDDGELQDNRVRPHIDFLRDSPEEIERKIHQRGRDAVEAGGGEEWKKAVVEACMRIESGYVASDPRATLRAIEEWWYQLAVEQTANSFLVEKANAPRPAPEADARDAARYRYLRAYTVWWQSYNMPGYWGEALDAAVDRHIELSDAAMSLPAQGREGDRG